MFTNLGFLGTKALLYMDIVTIYFALLPFLLLLSIYFATIKQYKKHFISQSIILVTTIIMVLVFEIGVRLSGGFMEFAKSSAISYDYLLIFLLAHIIIAITSVSGWIYQFIISYKIYVKNGLNSINFSQHKMRNRIVFLALTLNSIMGVCIYLFLFVI